MKKIAMLFAFVATTLLAVGCEGPSGPQGPPGPSVYPYVMEKSISFDDKPNDAVAPRAFSHPVRVYDGDVLLVYILDGNVTDNNGNKYPTWTPLPKRYFRTNIDTKIEHELEYTYNFSLVDFEIVASSDTNLGFFRDNQPGDINYLKNRTFRIVYVPGADPQMKSNSVKSTDAKTTLSYEEAVRKYNLEGVKVIKNY